MKKLGLLFFIFVTTIQCFSQSNHFSASMLFHEYDNVDNTATLDQTVDWTGIELGAINTIGIGYTMMLKPKLAIEPRIAFALNTTSFIFNGDLALKGHGYDTNYLNVGANLVYFVPIKASKLRLSAGPSLFFKVMHEQAVFEFGKTLVDSQIEDSLSNLAIMLQLQVSYMIDLFTIDDRKLGLEIGYTPALRLKGFYKDFSNLNFLSRGIKLGVYYNLDKYEE